MSLPDSYYQNYQNQLGSILQQQQGAYMGSYASFIPPQSSLMLDKEKEKKTMFKSLKEYADKHKDVLFTLVFILVLDHFIFNGAMREKVKSVLEGMLNKIQDKEKEIFTRISEEKDGKKA